MKYIAPDGTILRSAMAAWVYMIALQRRAQGKATILPVLRDR